MMFAADMEPNKWRSGGSRKSPIKCLVNYTTRPSGSFLSFSTSPISRMCSLTALRRISHVVRVTVMHETAIHAMRMPQFLPISFLVLKMIVRTAREQF
jgi:hypothetical protein